MDVATEGRVEMAKSAVIVVVMNPLVRIYEDDLNAIRNVTAMP